MSIQSDQKQQLGQAQLYRQLDQQLRQALELAYRIDDNTVASVVQFAIQKAIRDMQSHPPMMPNTNWWEGR
jgi:hypothetical protein